MRFDPFLRRRWFVGASGLMTAIILLFAAGHPVFAQSDHGELRLSPVRVALQWLPQSQFAGFYTARDKGFYRDAGLDVTLLHAGPGPSALDFLAQGEADFVTQFLADAIVNARKPVPLAHVAQLMRRSNLMLVAWKDMGIEKPVDLDGKRISCWPGTFSTTFSAFFRQHGIQPEILPQYHSVRLFLHRGVSACSAMLYNELHRIYQAGIDHDRLTLFMMRDYGLGLPEDGLYTTMDMAARNPEQCRALRRATMAGWDYARSHPEEAIDAVLRESRRSGVPTNRPHCRWMLDHVLASIFPENDEEPAGRLDPQTYRKAVHVLTAAGLVDEPPSFHRFAPLEQETP